MHVSELKRMGANLILDKRKSKLKEKKIFGAEVMATDLRASSSLNNRRFDGRRKNTYK